MDVRRTILLTGRQFQPICASIFSLYVMAFAKLNKLWGCFLHKKLACYGHPTRCTLSTIDMWTFIGLVRHVASPYCDIREEAPYLPAETSYVITNSYFQSFSTKLNIERKFYDSQWYYLIIVERIHLCMLLLAACTIAACAIHPIFHVFFISSLNFILLYIF